MTETMHGRPGASANRCIRQESRCVACDNVGHALDLQRGLPVGPFGIDVEGCMKRAGEGRLAGANERRGERSLTPDRITIRIVAPIQ